MIHVFSHYWICLNCLIFIYILQYVFTNHNQIILWIVHRLCHGCLFILYLVTRHATIRFVNTLFVNVILFSNVILFLLFWYLFVIYLINNSNIEDMSLLESIFYFFTMFLCNAYYIYNIYYIKNKVLVIHGIFCVVQWPLRNIYRNINYAPFEEAGLCCFAPVRQSVSRSVSQGHRVL